MTQLPYCAADATGSGQLDTSGDSPPFVDPSLYSSDLGTVCDPPVIPRWTQRNGRLAVVTREKFHIQVLKVQTAGFGGDGTEWY